jgi:low affinity Fe/Cu permease
MSKDIEQIEAAYNELLVTHEETEAQLKQIKLTQAGSDSKVGELLTENKSLKEQLEQTKADLGDNNLIFERLHNLETAYDSKVEKLELEYYAKGACLESGVNWELIQEIPFADTAAVDDKISQLAVVLQNAKYDAVNVELNNSTKPRTGEATTLKTAPVLTGSAGREQEAFERFNL